VGVFETTRTILTHTPSMTRRSSSGSSKSTAVSLRPRETLRAKSKPRDFSSCHPLKGGGSGADGITRPQLEKLLSGGDSLGADEDGGSVEDETGSIGVDGESEEAKFVLVHQVRFAPVFLSSHASLITTSQISPKDSLPGVAVKYGTTTTELRRANQLWSNDSIHLRQVLYIPVESDRAHLYAIGAAQTVIRMPVSQLSFFPPAPTKPTSKPLVDLSHAPLRHARSATYNPSIIITPSSTPPRNSHAEEAHTYSLRRRNGHHQRTLSSIFASIPIAARLSLDSSPGGSPEGMEHELDEVSYSHREPIPAAWRVGGKEGGARVLPYRSPTPPPNVPPEPRTAQLEPSAGMRLPAMRGKGQGRDEGLGSVTRGQEGLS
jgi:LysM repeat protein